MDKGWNLESATRNHEPKQPNVSKYILSLKLTVRTWKWMVGSDDPFLLGFGLFSGATCMLVSGRVIIIHDIFSQCWCDLPRFTIWKRVQSPDVLLWHRTKTLKPSKIRRVDPITPILLLMAWNLKLAPPFGWCWNPINIGINYQPQLVFTPDFSHQQYHPILVRKDSVYEESMLLWTLCKLGLYVCCKSTPSPKLTWQWKKNIIWRCISYYKWWFSIAMLVFGRVSYHNRLQWSFILKHLSIETSKGV